MPTTFGYVAGVFAVVLVLWGHFRALSKINKNLEDIKAVLEAKAK
jgi:hypothetical protein